MPVYGAAEYMTMSWVAGQGPPSGARLGVAVEAVALREDVELESIGNAELVVDAAQVIAQRVLADVQRVGKLAIVRARLVRQRAHHVRLARRKRRELAFLRVVRFGLLLRQLDEQARRG